MSHFLDHIIVILVRPQMGENIGAAARAMANFGLRNLRLVAPRDGWPNPRADSLSSGAFDHMEPVTLYDTLSDALHDTHLSYATTARPRDMVKDVLTPREATDQSYAHVAAYPQQKVAFVFGAERTGLENDEIAQCHKIVTAPTSDDFSSLNLGQGVLMLAYELFQAHHIHDADKPPAPITHETASQASFDNFFHRLEAALEDGGFFREDSLRPRVIRNLRSFFMRTHPTEQELKTLHGVLRSLVSLRGGKNDS